jgi:hypothetical protein
MIESLRGVGYSTATALADLIDNSISAGARNVWLEFKFEGPRSTIAILDDGSGMTPDELRRAMTLGGIGPLAPSAPVDLGRFGLGLKTANSLSVKGLGGAGRFVLFWVESEGPPCRGPGKSRQFW